MSTPKRLQRKRTKGWRKPAGAIYCGRPGPYGNPWRVVDRRLSAEKKGQALRDGFCVLTKEEAVARFEVYAMIRNLVNPSWLRPLRGRDLMDWCGLDEPCHVDVLLVLANQ